MIPFKMDVFPHLLTGAQGDFFFPLSLEERDKAPGDKIHKSIVTFLRLPPPHQNF